MNAGARHMGQFNYRRGLKRVYAVLSVLWIVTVLTAAVRNRPIAGWSLVRDQQTQADPLDALIDSLPDANGSARIYWTQRVSIMVLPPALGYAALFLVMPWIVRGFRRD